MRYENHPLITLWNKISMKNKKLFEQYFDELMYANLMERKTSTQTSITRQAKIARDIGARAVRVGKTQNDSLYKRMTYHLELYKKFKRQLLQKYGSRVKSKART